MKVLICGAGQVGYSIASYLSDENYQVTVIDQDENLVARVSEDLDVNGVVGFASNPDTMARADASHADLMIAVTRSDEVNMVACQIGHSLFGIPKKIARIREQSYLKPEWANLFSRAHMPIDEIISPEVIVAQDIYNRLSVPGTTYVATIKQGVFHVIGLIVDADSPLLQARPNEIYKLFPNLDFRIIAVLRKGESVVLSEIGALEAGDEIFLIVRTGHMDRVMKAFGKLQREARRIIVAGAGNVGEGVVKLIEERNSGEQVKLIEANHRRARALSEDMKSGVILHGDVLDRAILEEAGISKVDTFIAVTNDDETNILGSLLAKQYGAKRSITLVNNSAYSPLVGPLGVDSMVSPRALIVGQVMQYVRRGRILHIHNLRHGFAEVMEAQVTESAHIANKMVEDLDLPDSVMLALIVRGEDYSFPAPEDYVRPGDYVVAIAPQEHAQLVQKLFAVQVDLFD